MTTTAIPDTPTDSVGAPNPFFIGADGKTGEIPATLPPSVVSSSAEPGEEGLIPVSKGEGNKIKEWIKRVFSNLQKTELKTWGPWHFVRDFGGVADLEAYSGAETTAGSNTVKVISAQASWVGKCIAGQLAGQYIPRGSKVKTAVNGATTITIETPGETGAIANGSGLYVNIFTDNGPALESLWTAVVAAIKKNGVVKGGSGPEDPASLCSVFFGAGNFGVATPGAWMKLKHGVFKGFKMTGAGMDATTWFFAPNAENVYMGENIQSLYSATFRDMTFKCNDATAMWMLTIAPPGNFYRYYDCRWTGSWKYSGMDLVGPNDNSDSKWYGCIFDGEWVTYQHSAKEGSKTTAEVAEGATSIPVESSANYEVGQVVWFCREATGEAAVATVEKATILEKPDGTHITLSAGLAHSHVSGTFVSGGSDQYLNYDFFGCSAQYAKGNLLDMYTGGNINWYGGGLIHTGNGESEQIHFALRGQAHQLGVCRININGTRVEPRHIRSKILLCEWNSGVVNIDNIDTSTVAGGTAMPQLPTEVATTLSAEAAAGASTIQVAASGGAHPFTVGMQVVVLANGKTRLNEGRVVKAIPDGTHIELNAPLTYAHGNGVVVEQASRKYLQTVDIRYPLSLQVSFRASRLCGQHIYGFAQGEEYLYQRNFRYELCELVDYEYAGGRSNSNVFIYSFSTGGGENPGAFPPVKFVDCVGKVGSGGWRRQINGTVNGSTATATKRELHTAAFRMQQGYLPNATNGTVAEINIHGEARIVAIRAGRKAGGAQTNTNWVFKLLDEANGGAVIAEAKGGGTVELKNGFALQETKDLERATEGANWLLKLVAENVSAGNGTPNTEHWEVDYIA